MTVQIARGYISSTTPKRTKAEGQVAWEQTIAITKELPGGNGVKATALTLVNGKATIENDYCLFKIEGEGGLADDFTNIDFNPSGDIRNGMIVGFMPTTQAITFKHGAGGTRPIYMRNLRDYTTSDASEIVWLRYDSVAIAFFQVFIDVSRIIDYMPGSQDVSTLTVSSSSVTATGGLHYVTAGAPANIQAILGSQPNGAFIGICKAPGSSALTLKHNISTTGKTVLQGSSDIVMASNVWYFFHKNGSQFNHMFSTLGTSPLNLPGSANAQSLLFGDGSGGWASNDFSAITAGWKLVKKASAPYFEFVADSGGGATRVNNYRLSVSSSDPEPGDTTGASTIYNKEYNGNAVDIYNGSGWTTYTALSLSIGVPGSQYFRIYDVYLDYNLGTPQLVVTPWDSGGQVTKTITAATAANPCVITTSAAHGLSIGDKIGITKGTGTGTGWTDAAMGLDRKEFYVSAVPTTTTIELEGCDTSALTFSTFTGSPTLYKIPASRTTAIVRQNGTWCKSGTLTHRLLGTFKTNGAGTVDDSSASARNLSNVDNKVKCHVGAIEPAASWSSPSVTKMVPRSSSLAKGVTRFEFVLALPAVVDFNDTDTSTGTSIASAISLNRVQQAAYGAMQNLVAYSTGGYGSAYPEGMTGVEGKALAAGSYFAQKMAYGSGSVYSGDLYSNYAGAEAHAQALLWR